MAGSGYESAAGNTRAGGGDGGQDAPFSWMDAREWMCWATGKGHGSAFLNCACIDLHPHQQYVTWLFNQEF